jgi:hypothetical protein
VDASFDRVTQRTGSGSARRLSVDLTAAWQDIDECAHGISRFADTIRDTPAEFHNLDDTRAWYDQVSRQLLIDPVGQFVRRQPMQRALDAMRICGTGSSRARWRLDTRFERLLTRAALDLCEPWRIWRGGNLGVEWQRWHERWDGHARASSALLLRYAQWEQRERHTDPPAAVAVHPPRDVEPDTRSGQRALIATIDVELALHDLTLKWFDAARAYAADVHRERDALQSYTDATVWWLEHGAPPGPEAANTFELMAPEERLRSWSLAVETEASVRLPDGIEVLAPGTIVHPAIRRRSVPARKQFLGIFDTYARPEMRAIVDQCWNAHAARLREVEQTKEMIAYWREASTSGSAGTPDLLAEGRHNAIAALRAQQQGPADEGLDARIADAFLAWHKKGLIAFEGEEYGWVALLERPRGRELLDTAWDAGRARAHTALHRAARWASAHVDRAMESVVGRVPSRPVLPAVVRRTTLHDTLALETAKSELPALYRSLFRLTPVEDRRFLLGRDDELAGLQQALDDWRRKRFAACLVVGARGSGKTSLLNCAVEAIFAGEFLIRAECNDRITSPARLDAFLRGLHHVDDRADLEAAFDAGRRILIIEEAERIYLRRVGGFAAADYLTHLIQRTAATTLWIVVMNDRSFLVLDAGTHLHRVFSHRINAMNVSRSDLERAILARHRLTGLRLEFAPPPPEDPRVSRAKRWLGLEESAQKLFFDSLYQQSEGIFRSAFQLWLSSIEKVDGETLKIRQPLDPAFTRFRSELAQEDHFTLSVIQQHGSLTQDELAGVLCEAPERSRSRMERLTALGLVERDPEHPGLRLNPEAQRFVNDLLRRANLT